MLGSNFLLVMDQNTTWEKRSGDTFDLRELFRADPFKCRLPPPLFRHVDFLYELQAPQHIRYIIQPPHFGCKRSHEQDYLLPTQRLVIINVFCGDLFLKMI